MLMMCVGAPFLRAALLCLWCRACRCRSGGGRRAANTMATEVGWPMQDLVYGCTGVIDRLQQKIRAQHELATT